MQQEIKRSGYDGLLPAGIVLCGGTAQLPGMRDLARTIFELPVQIGIPRGISGLTDKVSGPDAAVAVGGKWTPLWEEGGGWRDGTYTWLKRLEGGCGTCSHRAGRGPRGQGWGGPADSPGRCDASTPVKLCPNRCKRKDGGVWDRDPWDKVGKQRAQRWRL